MAMHTWPEVMNVAPASLSANVSSMSVSGATMAASLPPSSSTTGRTAPDAAAMTARPVGTPPVNDTMSTPGWDTSISPICAPWPVDGVDHARRQGVSHAAATASTAPGQVGGAFHHGVAGEQGGQHLVPEHRDRPIQWQQRGDDPEGLVHDARCVPTPRHRPGGQSLLDQGGEGAGHPPDGARVELRLPQHLAVLAPGTCSFDARQNSEANSRKCWGQYLTRGK